MPMPVSMTPLSWPAETDLVLTPGSNKIMLTKQQDLVHAIIQDLFENLRAALLLENAFPNPGLQASFVRDSLFASAKAMPGAASVLMRLQKDMTYLRRLLPVVSPCTFELGWAEIVCSRVLVYLSFEVKLKSTAVNSSTQRFWASTHLMTLCNLLRSSYRTTIICTPRHQM